MKNLILQVLKYAALPFALLYGLVIFIRNRFYDLGIFHSTSFNLPVICVGNITVGGTGKSPHIEYLVELLTPMYKVATLSRGYRRHSRGFRIANPGSTSRDIGDEPFQYHSKYPQITVCVAEERMTAIPALLQQQPHIQIILMDDAFQHRSVSAGLNILLTDHDRVYTRDHIMPFGLLREGRSAAKRAQLIVVSKCPADMNAEQREALRREIAPQENQQLFFSGFYYKNMYPLLPGLGEAVGGSSVLLVSGIANPKPLVEYLQDMFPLVHHLEYKDHHYFTYDDLEEIRETFAALQGSHKVIVTTEKDASRLMILGEKIKEYGLPFYAQPVGVRIMFDEEQAFQQEILSFVEGYIPRVEDESSLSPEPGSIE